MIDPRLLHQVTVEMTTGFLVLAGLTVLAKLLADGWSRRFDGRIRRLDAWAAKAAAFAEPASFVALLAGVLSAVATIYTGSHAWPADQLIGSATVHNKIFLVGLSQGLFIGALAFRLRFGARIWSTRPTGALYAMLVLAGNGVMVVQNSVGGHLMGSGSILDDVLRVIDVDETVLWTLPPWFALGCVVAFPILTIALGLRLRSSNMFVARYELEPLALRVRNLLGSAEGREAEIRKPLRLVRKANTAVRRRNYLRAVKLLLRALRHLTVALPQAAADGGSVARAPAFRRRV